MQITPVTVFLRICGPGAAFFARGGRIKVGGSAKRGSSNFGRGAAFCPNSRFYDLPSKNISKFSYHYDLHQRKNDVIKAISLIFYVGRLFCKAIKIKLGLKLCVDLKQSSKSQRIDVYINFVM